MLSLIRCRSVKSAISTHGKAKGSRPALFGLMLFLGLFAGATTASAVGFGVITGNLDAGFACATPPSTNCLAEQDFVVGGSYPIAGTVDIDLGLGLIDINITVATATMTGSFGGVAQIDFTTMTYTVDDMPIIFTSGAPFSDGSQVFGGPKSGQVDGTYEQFDGGASSVAGPSAVNVPAEYNSFSCLFNGGIGVCGFSAGSAGGFTLDVGDTSNQDHDFRHTFNFSVIPEPGTLGLLAAGLAGLAYYRRSQG